MGIRGVTQPDNVEDALTRADEMDKIAKCPQCDCEVGSDEYLTIQTLADEVRRLRTLLRP